MKEQGATRQQMLMASTLKKGGDVASKRERWNKTEQCMIYEALYRHNGKQTSAPFYSEKARDRWIALVDKIGVPAAVDSLNAFEASGGSDVPTLAEYALADIGLRTRLSDYQHDRYRREIENDWDFIGELPIDLVTDKHVRAWIKQLQGRKLSAKSIANKHGLMASVFKAAMNDPDLEMYRNPCASTALPRDDRSEEELGALTPSEFATLLDYIPDFWKPFVTASAGLATRFGETTALQVSAFQADTGAFGEISVHRAWKRQADGTYQVGAPKTRRGTRRISLDPAMSRVLTEACEGKSPDDLIFTGKRGGRITHSGFYTRVWQPAIRLANGLPLLGRDGKTPVKMTRRNQFWGIEPATDPLGKWPTIHSLRHSGAVWAVEATGDLQVVQHFLGHESIKTTMDRYADFLPHRRAVMAKGMAYGLANALPEIVGDSRSEIAAQ